MGDLTCAGCGKQAPRRHHRQKFCRTCAEGKTPRKTRAMTAAAPNQRTEKHRVKRSLEQYLDKALQRLV